MEKNEKKIDELIGYRPGWIIRNGNLLFIIFFMLLFAASHLIRYSEVVTEPVSFYDEFQLSPDSNLVFTASEHFAGKLHINDTVIITLKLPAASDSLMLKTIVTNTTATGTANQRNFVVSTHVLHNTGNMLLLTSAKNVTATAQIILAKQRLSNRLWEGLKSSFTINNNK